jgi:hypothetical protein
MWNKSKLNRNYLKKMLDKQVEMKEDTIQRQREESLQNYLEDIKGNKSVSKSVLYGSKAWNKKS